MCSVRGYRSPRDVGLLDTCYEIACTVSVQFNVRKCHCLVVGKLHTFAISPMSLAGQEIRWCDQIKYLGIYLVDWHGVELLNVM